MKILQLLPSLQNGGAEKFVCELANQLVKNQRISCDIALMYDVDPDSPGFISMLKNVKFSSFGKKSGFSFTYLVALYQFIKRNKYDVVHAHLNTITYLLLSAFLLRRVKFVATIHSDARFEAPGIIDRLVRKLLFLTKKVQPVTISESSNESFKEYYSISAPVIYNGISPYVDNLDEPFALKKKSNDLIFIHPASCQPVKNQKLLLEVFKNITEKHKNVFLYWYGNNSANTALFSELSEYFSDNIKYCGCVEDMRIILKEADAMCLTSTIEGMPMVIIESFSVGCIPIVTPAGGCVNMIDNGRNGFISKTFEFNDYYKLIEYFISLSELDRRKISIGSFDSFQKYSIEHSVKSYLKLYNDR